MPAQERVSIQHGPSGQLNPGQPQTALAERYLEEGLRMDEHPLIYFRDGANGRRPALLGTRLDVADVIETLRQNDRSVERTAVSCRFHPNG